MSTEPHITLNEFSIIQSWDMYSVHVIEENRLVLHSSVCSVELFK